MDLVVTKKVNYLIPVCLFVGTFVLSMIQINQTSLPFALPLLIVSFCSGYTHLIIYLVSSTIVFLLTQQIFTMIVIYTFLCVLFVLNFFKIMKTKNLPLLFSILSIPFLYLNQYTYFEILFMTVLNFINCYLYLDLLPIFIHYESDIYNKKRLMIICVTVETMMLSLTTINTGYSMILLRYFLLIAIYYLSIETIMPTILYISFIMILISPMLKDEILALILPMSFFFMKQPKNKLLFSSMFVISHVILPIFITYDYQYYSFTILIPLFMFMVSPKIKHHTLKISNEFQEITFQNQLKNKAESFASLYKQLTDIFKEESKQTNISEYIGYVYEEVCSGCPSRDYCFYSQDGMSRLGKLMNKGMLKELDIKDIDYIQQHCLNPEDYLESIDHQQKSYQKMTRVNSVNDHMKKELFQELEIMSHVFQNFSKSIKSDNDENNILEHLKAYQFDVVFVKKNKHNQNYSLEIGVEDIDENTVREELLPILESFLGESLDVVSIQSFHKYLGYTSVILKHELKYSILFSKQQYSLDSKQCGDSYISFHHQHHQYVALSDGMGQGYVAHKESQLTLDVLFQLIKNDISLKDTLNSINALLKIKNQGDMYTTLDLLDFNLINARVKVIKYGATDSYLIRDNKIDVISSHSLPVGMSTRLKILSYDVKLKENDIFIMTSDGVGENFLKILETYKDKISEMEVYEISSFLYNQAFHEKNIDDMTILTLKVINRK
ncbi:MAG: SpoIIE family protein phosphatase [Faecalibacillus sp.]